LENSLSLTLSKREENENLKKLIIGEFEYEKK